MKFFHISDLHIGKKLREMDITKDQEHILNEIIEMADEHEPDAVLIAGDVYDRSVPPAHALNLLDNFITRLESRDIRVFIVSGNHDSPDRLQFAKGILEKNNIHIAGTFNGQVEKVELRDEYGPINIYLLPFIKPSIVSNFYKKETIDSYEKAFRLVIDGTDINTKERNVLISHQFVTNAGAEPEASESESIRIGGLDNIDVSAFDPFDYVALGHIHRPQKVGRETVRYCGTPLKYSFSEHNHKKSVSLIEIKEKDDISITKLPLNPIRDMRIIKDTLENLLHSEEYTKYREDFIYAIVTDEEDVFDPIGQLRSVYKYVLLLEIENTKSQYVDNDIAYSIDVKKKDPLELFQEFYFNQKNEEMTESQEKILIEILDELGGES